MASYFNWMLIRHDIISEIRKLPKTTLGISVFLSVVVLCLLTLFAFFNGSHLMGEPIAFVTIKKSEFSRNPSQNELMSGEYDITYDGKPHRDVESEINVSNKSQVNSTPSIY